MRCILRAATATMMTSLTKTKSSKEILGSIAYSKSLSFSRSNTPSLCPPRHLLGRGRATTGATYSSNSSQIASKGCLIISSRSLRLSTSLDHRLVCRDPRATRPSEATTLGSAMVASSALTPTRSATPSRRHSRRLFQIHTCLRTTNTLMS